MRAWTQQKQDDQRAVRWLWVSILLHLPLTPLGQLFGLAALFSHTLEAPAPVEELNGIPVELLEQATPAAEAQPEPEPAEPVATVAQTAIIKKPKAPRNLPEDALDAGTPGDDAGVDRPSAGLDASAPIAIAADAGVAVAQAPSPAEALSAATHGIADSNAAVQMRIYMNRIRQQPLGAEVGRLLASLNQWRDFFPEASLDPVRDLDQIWLVAPELRTDSSKVAVFLKHNVRVSRMRGAVDTLVKNSGGEGEWLKDTKYPVAHAFADRAQRSIVMYPGQVVAVVPPRIEKDALKLSGLKLPVGNGEEVMWAFVKTPSNPLGQLGFDLPKSIRSATIKIFAASDGGARIEAELDDKNSEVAQKDAKQIQREVDSVRLVSVWLPSSFRFAEPIRVSVNDHKINAVLEVSRSQANLILGLVQGALTPEGRRATREAIKGAMRDAGARAPLPSSQDQLRTNEGTSTAPRTVGSAPIAAPVAPSAPIPPSDPVPPTPPTRPTPEPNAQ